MHSVEKKSVKVIMEAIMKMQSIYVQFKAWPALLQGCRIYACLTVQPSWAGLGKCGVQAHRHMAIALPVRPVVHHRRLLVEAVACGLKDGAAIHQSDALALEQSL